MGRAQTAQIRSTHQSLGKKKTDELWYHEISLITRIQIKWSNAISLISFDNMLIIQLIRHIKFKFDWCIGWFALRAMEVPTSVVLIQCCGVGFVAKLNCLPAHLRTNPWTCYDLMEADWNLWVFFRKLKLTRNSNSSSMLFATELPGEGPSHVSMLKLWLNPRKAWWNWVNQMISVASCCFFHTVSGQ